MGKIEVQSFKNSTYFWNFSDNFVQNIVKFSHKIFAIFGLKSSKLRRFFGFWKWTKDEDEDGSSDKNLRSFEDLRSFVATLHQRDVIYHILLIDLDFCWYAVVHYNKSTRLKIKLLFRISYGRIFKPKP